MRARARNVPQYGLDWPDTASYKNTQAAGGRWGRGAPKMKEAFSREVTIQPGGVVRIQSPDLPSGAKARVVVIIEEPGTDPPPLASLMRHSRPAFKSAAEVDAFIRRERDEWGS